MEDYLVCLRGTFWSHEGKDIVRIYIQEPNGTLRVVFEDYAYFSMPNSQPPVAVLVERVEDYHLLALPGTNSLLRYSKENKQYEFCEVKSSAEEITEDEIHAGMTEKEYAEKKEMYENIKHAEMSIFIDYEFIEAKHKILRHNICISPKDDYYNTVLKEYIEDDVDYFSFDFNDDGLEDYLVCYHGSGWSGSGGNYVCIYVQENDGLLKEVFSITMRLHEYAWSNEHSPIAILDEKDDGYYAFVAVGTNRIHRYDKEEGRYVFADE